MKIELVIEGKIIEVLEQDKDDKQKWNINSGSWLYGNEIVDYINWRFDEPPLNDISDIPW